MLIIIYHYDLQQFLDKPCTRVSRGGTAWDKHARHVSCFAYLLASEVEEHSHEQKETTGLNMGNNQQMQMGLTRNYSSWHCRDNASPFHLL